MNITVVGNRSRGRPRKTLEEHVNSDIQAEGLG